mgnify:FL=1
MQCCAISDAHNDFLTNEKCDLPKLNDEFEKNNVVLCNAILFSNDASPLNFSLAKQLRNRVNDNLYLKKSCIFSFENIGFVKKVQPLLDFAPFSCSLTWNYDNKFAGGAFGFSGLTTKGQNLVKVLNENKTLIDTAHLNRRSFWDVVKLIKHPIFNSHTCVSAFKEHRRNIDIEQVKAIFESKGFLGITFVQEFFSNKKRTTYVDIFYIIDAIVQAFGCESIGLGSDFYGTTNLPHKLKNYNDFCNLYKCFKNAGYKESDIEKIFYKNFVNFVKTQKSNCI